MINYSEIDGKEALSIGGRGTWIVNHCLGIGMGGTGFFNDYKYDNVLNENVHFEGGYGGLVIEPIIFPKMPVHIAFPVLIGVGGITLTGDYIENDYEDWSAYVHDADAYMIIEPGVELELNIVKFLRIALSATYRYTTDVELYYPRTGVQVVDKDVLHGITAGITFKFGKF